MYLSPDDARSDVILAAAATVIGGIAIRILMQLPFYPSPGLVRRVLDLVWIFALTGLVPLLLARYRGDGARAFGLSPPRSAWTTGLAIAVPAVLVGGLVTVLRGGGPTEIVLGRLAGLLGGFGVPAYAPAVAALEFAVLTMGALLLVTFLTNRGREAFRPTEVSLTQLVRTLGVGAAGVALILGLLRSLVTGSPLIVLVNAVGLLLIVLLADRLVPAGQTVTRATIVTPVVVVAVAHVFATGGLFRGDLPFAIYSGALGAGVAAAVAALTQTRARAWVAVPMLVALHWWPTCLSPLTFDLGAC